MREEDDFDTSRRVSVDAHVIFQEGEIFDKSESRSVTV
jgi:hypothetical protein